MEIDGQRLEQLAGDCVMHLEREERALQEMVEVLTTVRGALRTGDNQLLAEAADNQDRGASQLHAVRVDRGPLRRAIAEVLGLPEEEATVLRFVERTPQPHRSRLMQLRSRVAELAKSAEQLMQGNAIVVIHGMQLLQQILTCLTGRDGGATTYESTGRPVTAAGNAVFQTRC